MAQLMSFIGCGSGFLGTVIEITVFNQKSRKAFISDIQGVFNYKPTVSRRTMEFIFYKIVLGHHLYGTYHSVIKMPTEHTLQITYINTV